MADDIEIVMWLRELAASDATDAEECVYTDAADEIERLRELFAEQARVNRDTGLEVLRLRAAVERSYSLLWSVMTDNHRVHDARRLLLGVLTKEQQRAALAANTRATDPTSVQRG